MINQFTPGPWRIAREGGMRYIRTANNKIVSAAYSMLDGIDNTNRELEADANARLVAAAPALYEALQMLLDTETNMAGCSAIKLLDAVDKARAALALVDYTELQQAVIEHDSDMARLDRVVT